MNEDVKLCECIATEDDWLDISYSQRNYIQEEQDALSFVRINSRQNRQTNALSGAKKWIVRSFVCVLVLGTLIAMNFVENGFAGEVFALAKSGYNQNIVQVIAEQQRIDDTINLPINVTVDSVDNGTVSVTGGKVLLNFKKGTVSDATETTVTVAVDDKLQIVYSGLTKVLVSVGDSLSEQAVLGKYSDIACVNLLYDGEVVKDITTVNYSLVWKV